MKFYDCGKYLYMAIVWVICLLIILKYNFKDYETYINLINFK